MTMKSTPFKCEMSDNEGYSLREIRGDLFESTECLAHCVSRDLNMGRGIAVAFKRNYGRVDELQAQKKDVGETAVLRVEDRFVYYLVTKERYWEKPTYRAVRLALIDMKQHLIDNEVHAISMPRIGCGLDKLQWCKVKAIVDDLFEEVSIRISIYHLD